MKVMIEIPDDRVLCDNGRVITTKFGQMVNHEGKHITCPFVYEDWDCDHCTLKDKNYECPFVKGSE